MAILNGLLRKMSGSAGDLTFKALNGQTVVSEKMTKMTNPRSSAQMRVRTRWRNVLAMYSGIRPLLRHGFESKPVGLSDYNMFVKVNMQRTPVYLTKQQVAGGACVAAPYQLTQGSLPAIVVSGTGANAFTDIYLGGVTISGTTTVGQFSKAVVDNNEDYRYGDQISYFLVKQKVNADTQIPYCQFRACCVVLDENNADKLWDVVDRNGFSLRDSALAHSGDDGDCVYAWVHSRQSYSGELLVSSQSFVNANSKLADYTSELAYNLASSSYGIGEDAFLVPTGVTTTSAGDGGNAGGGDGGGDGGNDSL